MIGGCLANRIGGMKTCTTCRLEKGLSEFYRLASGRVDSRCKPCKRAENKARYHADPVTRARNIAAATESNKRLRERRLQRAAERYASDENTRERIANNRRAYYERNRRDPILMMRKSIGAAIRRVIGSAKAGSRWFEVIGYAPTDLKRHLERQFLRGMSWENYGEWHIDHIIPIASFDFSDNPREVAREAWSLPNLRPIWKADNMRKHAKRTHLL